MGSRITKPAKNRKSSFMQKTRDPRNESIRSLRAEQTLEKVRSKSLKANPDNVALVLDVKPLGVTNPERHKNVPVVSLRPVETSDHSNLMAPPRVTCQITPEAFQEIVIERVGKVRLKAEEKRQQGLRRIMEMNSRVGINPLELMPKEIWVKVLDKLEPADRASMRQVHDVFGDLMESTSIQNTLFPLVMQYGIPLVQGPPPPYTGPRSFPGKKDLKELTTLRQVSKCLRDSVDKWFEERLLHFRRTSRPRFRMLRHFQDGLDDSYRQVLNTVDLFRTEYSNPPKRFFLRSVRVKIPAFQLPEEVEVSTWNRIVTEFLRQVGEQILHLDLHFDLAYYSANEVPSIVREWLMLVPNLKWLVLEAQNMRDCQPNGPPMPKLCELERFDLCGRELFSLGDAILDANPHIKTHPRAPSLLDGYRNDAAVSKLELENAYFGGISGIGCTTLCSSVPLLPQEAFTNWKLKRMELWLHAMPSGSTSMDDILQFIQKFPTLEDIQLHIDDVTIGSEINFLRLPNLKELWMDIGPDDKSSSGEIKFFHSLQFLIHCGRLRTLTWENKMDASALLDLEERLRGSALDRARAMWSEDSERDEEIRMDFNGGDVDLRRSNVWDAFPELRSLTVRFPYASPVYPYEVMQKCFRGKSWKMKRYSMACDN